MKYYSAKSFTLPIMGLGVVVMCLFCALSRLYILATLIALFVAYLLWVWVDTYYEIKEGGVFYKSALIKGTIEINSITQLIKNQTLSSGTRPALSNNGIIIKYNRWDEIYISPDELDAFINDLLLTNKEIRVKG